MKTIGYFSKFPAIFKDREKTVKDIIFVNINTTMHDNNIVIHASTNKYQQELEIHDKTIHINSPVKIFCSCESFKFEFANSVFKTGSLLNQLDLLKSIVTRPKEKNQHNIPSGCKHIVALIRQILKSKTIIKLN